MSKPKTAKSPKKPNPNSKVNTTAYKVFLAVLWFMSAYLLFQALTFTKSAKYKSTSATTGALALGIPVLLLALIMTFFKVRDLKRSHIRLHPLRSLKEKLIWMRDFLMPTVYKCRVTEEKGNGAAALVSDFREEYTGFFTGGELKENVTQMYGHQLELHRKRLNDLCINMSCEWKRLKMKEEAPVKTSVHPDGKLKMTLAEEHVKGRNIFTRNGKKVFISRGIYGADYDMVGTVHDDDAADRALIHCPNCGSSAAGRELIKGCPFCGTVFAMEELEDRVCNYSLFKDPYFDRSLAGLKINGHLNRFSFLIGLLFTIVFASMLKEVFIQSGEDPSILPFVILLFSFSNILLFLLMLGAAYLITIPLRLWLIAIYKSAQKRRSRELKVMERNREKLAAIHGTDPEFSLQSFLSNVRNKTASIHYADSETDMEVFSAADLSGQIDRYRNVFDCQFGPVALEDYRASGEVREADVTMEVQLFRLDGETVRTEKEQIRMKLKRLTGLPEKNPFGIHSVRCGSCGHPLDLRKGNTCTFCGQKWDLSRYDWCIHEYCPVIVSERS